jgi:methionyl-tRNA formyltransferase
MRTALVGAVESSAVLLRAMIRLGEPPLLVATLPLANAGRHSDFVDLRPTCAAAGIPVLDAPQVNAPEVVDALRRLDLDHLFVVGWSQIVRPELLAVSRGGAIGLHPAPLPELRGRAVLPWTILLGRTSTGLSLFWLDDGMDTGDILAQEVFPVAPDETAATLYAKHMSALERIADEVIPALARGERRRRPQDHSRASYCAKRTPADGLLDFARPAHEVWTFIRAVGDPYPGAFTFSKGRKLTVWSADLVPQAPYFGIPGQVQLLEPEGVLVACAEGFVRLRTVQLEGEGRAPARQVLKIHERLGIDWLALLAGAQR